MDRHPILLVRVSQIPWRPLLSVSMMLRYSLGEAALAGRIDAAVKKVLDDGLRTADIFTEGLIKVSTKEMGEAVITAI